MNTNLLYLDPPTIDKFEERANVSRLLSKVLKVKAIDNGILAQCESEPNYFAYEVFDKHGILLKGTNPNVIYQNTYPSLILDDSIKKVDQTVIFLGTIMDCWGHYFTDGISKLWFLKTEEYKSITENNHVKFAISFAYKQNLKIPQPLLSLYHLLGIHEEDLVIINNPVQYSKIYIPDNSLFMYGNTRYFTAEYSCTIDDITSQVAPINNEKYDKIYLSRAHFLKGNADFGEKYIERVFKSLNYTIIHPQEYTVEEQISIFQQAKSVITTSGSLAHNSVFCQAKTDVVILNKCCATIDYQFVIDEVKQLNVNYVDVHLTCFTNLNPNLGPFYLYINDNLVRFIKDKYDRHVNSNFSTSLFFKYTRLCMKREDFKNRNQAPEYYYQKLRAELLQDSWEKRYYEVFDKMMPRQLMGIMKRIYYNLYR